ncbi:MAG TPA: tetratricopeptide repeat protein [Ignavibacteria bacterium]|nr:tetratricopeptide repeat protein [Ignavibacteria bacterium]HMQ98059.1 tetratricopeptide repeat protein [Ignavibacteria bacterium]
MKKLLMLLLLLISFSLYSQTDKEKALQYGKEGIKLVDNGKLDEGIELFEKAGKLDPENIIYPYEIAYAYCLKNDYSKSIEICESLKKRTDVLDEVYRLLGNCYDFTGNQSKAIETYREGISKFPASGKLYHEEGVCYSGMKEYEKAINSFQKGIEAEPNYSSNYYDLSKLYYFSEEELWALVYAETFINLERNSKRTADISKLLYDTYKKGIIIKSEKEAYISLSKSPDLTANKLLLFETNYETCFSLAMITADDKSLSLKSLSSMRQSFFKIWYEKGFNEKYKIGLFDYIKDIYDNGYGDAYDYYIMGYGDEDFVTEWASKNKDQYSKFEKYYIANKLKLTNDNSVYRGK